MNIDDTIAALASPPGAAGRGIIRISGGGLREVIEACFLSGGRHPPECDSDSGSQRPQGVETRRSEETIARRSVGWWRIDGSSARIPCDLWFWPDQRSYAGQPTVELHLPGSPPLLEKVLEDLSQRNIRPARPGEFTLRAFLAGKIDLVQAEAVLGVIDAADDAELRTALSQLAGGISQRLMQLRNNLLDLLADLEAGLDFVEEDISFVSRADVHRRLDDAGDFVQTLIAQSDSRMTSTTSRKVVLAGLPNAGKSTLFNRLAGERLALVSPEQGTTTDYLRADVQLAGVEFELIDTAGWETEITGIPAAAQHQRAGQLERADLILWCSASDLDQSQRRIDDAGYRQFRCGSIPVVRVETKSDLPSGGSQPLGCASFDQRHHSQGADAPRSGYVVVSALAEHGMDALAMCIACELSASTTRSSAWLGTTSARCRDSLQHALSALRRAAAAAGESTVGDELLAVDLRESLDHLGQVVGAVYTDDLLDRIFSKFCIGK